LAPLVGVGCAVLRPGSRGGPSHTHDAERREYVCANRHFLPSSLEQSTAGLLQNARAGPGPQGVFGAAGAAGLRAPVQKQRGRPRLTETRRDLLCRKFSRSSPVKFGSDRRIATTRSVVSGVESEGQDDYFLGGAMASLAAFATRNFTTVLAGILMASPVCGLRPMRALR